MEIIALKNPKTQRAIKCFFCKSKVEHLAKQSFFSEWSSLICNSEAVKIAEWYDDFISVLEVESHIAFDNMADEIESEIAGYPFQSTEWGFK